MKALEFETEVINNTIEIPEKFQSELSLSKDKFVRVIVMIDELDKNEEIELKKAVANQFLKGYDEHDAIYDDLNGIVSKY
jgi:hypothetical protein